MGSEVRTCPTCKRRNGCMVPNQLRCWRCMDELTALGRNPARFTTTRDALGVRIELVDPVLPSEKRLTPEQRRAKLRVVRP
jgi:hypothetical protein